jgi:soluble lytic murein transglycosylase-like protein
LGPRDGRGSDPLIIAAFGGRTAKPAPIFRPVYISNREWGIEERRHQVVNHIHHLPVARIECRLDMAETNRVVDATQRMDSPGGIAQHGAGCILEHRLDQQLTERRGFKTGQITSNHQVIGGLGPAECRFEAAERALVRPKILPTFTQRTVPGHWTQENRGTGSLLDLGRYLCSQCYFGGKRKQRFVLSHARTTPSYKDKAGRSHDRMVASAGLNSGYNRKNKVRPFCFIFALGLLAGSLNAGDESSLGKANLRSGPVKVTGMVSVVRVGHDGRLVRVLAPSSAKPLLKPELQAALLPARVTPVSTALFPPTPLIPIAQPTQTIDALIEDASNRYQVDPLLVRSLMQVESNFNPAALSPKGAQGLMQLIPATAQRFGVTDPFDSKQNIEGGVKYLRHLQDLFPSDLRLSLAAYNAGEGAVAKYGAIPPYKETVDYVQKVHQRYSTAKGIASSKSAPVMEAAAPEEPPVRHIEQVIDSEGRLFLRTR